MIDRAIESVLKQDYPNIEYIIIDGGSTDGTLEVIKRYEDRISKLVSEPDNGIYDAMNKGVRLASGDFIGFLNSDDFYPHRGVISLVARYLSESGAETCYGDIYYVDRDNPDRIIRCWRSGPFKRSRFNWGWMPPHPAFFAHRRLFEKYGGFRIELPVTADYELMLRLLYKHQVSTVYIPEVLVHMRTGGNSRFSLLGTTRNCIECYHGWRLNGLNPFPGTFVLKPLLKAGQFINALRFLRVW